MKFTKIHGAGNDFIVINNMEEKIPVEKLNSIAKTLCTRRLSIGADGFMAVDKPENDGDFKMRFYNSDGSEGEMCGNGVRSIARYGYEQGLAGEELKIETVAGMIVGWRISERQYKVRLNDVTTLDLNRTIEVDGKEYECSYVELGNPGLPHAVVPIKDLKNIDRDELRDLARKLRYHKDFSKGANVNFYDVIGEDEVQELTYERGVEDFTYACGTGTGSTVTVLTKKGLVSGHDVKVHMQGGELFITAEFNGDVVENLYLTGPTNIVAEGEVLDEDLN